MIELALVAPPDLGRNLTYGLLETLGKAIATGRFQGVPFPTEAEVAQRYGVSRTVVREAIKMLTTKGLLSARPRQGTMVQSTAQWNLFDTDVLRWMMGDCVSPDVLVHLRQLRCAIEPEAATLAACNASGSDLRRLNEAQSQVLHALHAADGEREARRTFHVAILQSSRNPFFYQLRSLIAAMLFIPPSTDGGQFGIAEQTFRYSAVGDAIGRRDPAAARLAMQRLLTAVQP